MVRLPRASNSYQKASHAQTFVNDQLSVAKFQLLSFIASLFDPFLAEYQADWPVFPFMYAALTDFVRNLLQLYIKQDVLAKCSSGSALKQLDPSKRENLSNIEFAANLTLSEMKREDLVAEGKFTNSVGQRRRRSIPGFMHISKIRTH